MPGKGGREEREKRRREKGRRGKGRREKGKKGERKGHLLNIGYARSHKKVIKKSKTHSCQVEGIHFSHYYLPI